MKYLFAFLSVKLSLSLNLKAVLWVFWFQWKVLGFFFLWALMLSLIFPSGILISWNVVVCLSKKKSFSSLLLLDVKASDSSNSESPNCANSLSSSYKSTICSRNHLVLIRSHEIQLRSNQHTLVMLHFPTSSQRAAAWVLNDLPPSLSQVPVLQNILPIQK
jgi:hypothetical protein